MLNLLRLDKIQVPFQGLNSGWWIRHTVNNKWQCQDKVWWLKIWVYGLPYLTSVLSIEVPSVLIKFTDGSKLGDATNTTENQGVISEIKGIHKQNCH